MSAQLDPRGPRFAAALTTVVLAAVLLTAPGPVGIALLLAQAGLFALGVARGVQRTPVAWLYRTAVRPLLAPPTEWESPQPPRFAQAVGLGFVLVALAALVSGATTLGLVATGAAFAAAALNAVFGYCLGCELYLLAVRWSRRGAAAPVADPSLR